MPTMNALLDKAAAMCSPSNDSELSRRLGVSRSAVSLWRKGQPPKDEHLAALIAMAQQDPAIAVLIRQEQATTKVERALWGPLWDRLSPVTTTVAGVLLAVGLALPYTAQSSDLNDGRFVHYAKWRDRLRRALMQMAAWWRHEPPAVLA